MLSLHVTPLSDSQYYKVKIFKKENLFMLMKSQPYISAKRTKLFLFLMFAAISSTTHASQCGAVSPYLTTMGDSYYDVDYTIEGSENTKTVQQDVLEQSVIFTQLRDTHFTSGTGSQSRCFGTVDNQRVETINVELTDIQQQADTFRIDNELQIDANEYNKAEETDQGGSISFPLYENTNIDDSDNGKSLNLSTRTRQEAETGSVFREISINATLTDSGIDITRSLYVGGYLAEWVSWSLNANR